MNQSKLSLSLLSLALLLILPNCAQTEYETNESERELMNQQDLIPSENKTARAIKLFIYPNCPYCKNVIAALRASGDLSKVVVLDANNPTYFAELKQLTNGNTQCPFIFDEEKNIKMHESKDIIKYFQKRFVA